MSLRTATRLSDDLIGLLKVVQSTRQQAPRIHSGLDTAAYPLLFTLRSGPMRLSALAEQVHSDVSTVSRQVTTLVKSGLVDRRPDPDDRRAHLLRLRPETEVLLDQVRARRAAWFGEVLQGWTEQEAQQAIVALTRLRESIVASRDRLAADATASGSTLSVPASRPDLSTSKESA